VTNNLRPVPVPALVMERVRLAEEIGVFDSAARAQAGAIGEGTSVKVGDGAFADFVAKVQSYAQATVWISC
jgi:transcription antitermination factor NusG